MRSTLTVIRSPPNPHLLLNRHLAVTPKLSRFLDGACFDPFEPGRIAYQNSSRVLPCIIRSLRLPPRTGLVPGGTAPFAPRREGHPAMSNSHAPS
jgi:hypothetical protein